MDDVFHSSIRKILKTLGVSDQKSAMPARVEGHHAVGRLYVDDRSEDEERIADNLRSNNRSDNRTLGVSDQKGATPASGRNITQLVNCMELIDPKTKSKSRTTCGATVA